METDLMIALEPPGNIAREVALFRRRLFASLGEASALAFPEVVPLAIARSGVRRPGRLELESCWKGVEGSFAAVRAVESRGLMYLELSGPLETLASNAQTALSTSTHPRSSTLETGVGIFLCARADAEAPNMVEEAERLGVPRVGFADCALVLLRLRYGAADACMGGLPFDAIAWKELARARRFVHKAK